MPRSLRFALPRVIAPLDSGTKFTAFAPVIAACGLDELERAQFVAMTGADPFEPSSLYDGTLPDDQGWLRDLVETPVEIWQVFDQTEPLLDVWLYGADGGKLFRHGTTELVAYISQCALWCERDLELWYALWLAQRRDAPAGSELETMFFNLAVSCVCGALNNPAEPDDLACRRCGTSALHGLPA